MSFRQAQYPIDRGNPGCRNGSGDVLFYCRPTATPSGSAQGFVLTQQPHPKLLALKPEDSYMIKDLCKKE